MKLSSRLGSSGSWDRQVVGPAANLLNRTLSFTLSFYSWVIGVGADTLVYYDLATWKEQGPETQCWRVPFLEWRSTLHRFPICWGYRTNQLGQSIEPAGPILDETPHSFVRIEHSTTSEWSDRSVSFQIGLDWVVWVLKSGGKIETFCCCQSDLASL